ncbi:MAG TPA: GAF domain-containing protein [Syntrophales bacterium]|nr:GAF domain-containing protein [Syntrophales bacterium]
MNVKHWLNRLSVENYGIYYKLFIIFGLFFLIPIFGFLYFAIKYDFLSDNYIPIFFIVLLFFSLFGFIMLRKLFDEIVSISGHISKTVAEEFAQPQLSTTSELKGIVDSFQVLERELRANFSCLEKKTSEITILKELSDLCYMTFNTEDLLYITLERALKLTNADIGSIMMLEKPKRDAFVIEACIGLGDFVKKGDRVSFADRIAQYAVLNKTPLLVEDIETDIRFGRKSRPQYATKSFICMPLKTINDVIGVLTISRRKSDDLFTQEDVNVLSPLLSNAAFTYDNLRLLKESEIKSKQLQAMEKISSVINSSLRSNELLHTILQDIREVIPYDMAVVVELDEDNSGHVIITEFLSTVSTNLSRGNSYGVHGSVIDKVFKRQSSFVLEDTKDLSQPIDREIFLDHDFKTALLTPLKVDGQTTGVLVLCNVQMELLADMRNAIECMAGDLSRAIEKEKLSLAFVRRTHELETIRQIGNALSSSTFDTEKVLTYTMDMIRVIMNVEAGSLMLFENNELRCEIAFNIDMTPLKDFRLKLGQGIAGYAASRGRTAIAQNARQHPHFSHEFDELTGFETKAVLCAPLISQGRVIGVIEVLNKINGVFNDDDEHLLQAISTAVCIAMENARLYKETLAMAENERSIRKVFQKFVPKEIVDRIIPGNASAKPVVDEFKTVTLLNIDIRGYSELSKKIGPQKTVTILNYFFSYMGEIVFKHQGIVDKYLGDGFLAVFGAPVSTAKDADNATSAAVEMQKAMAHINEYFMKQYSQLLTMGISIHTGEVVVGNIGFDKKMDYTVIGDSANLVFKLQELCKPWPNSVIISEKTFFASQFPPAVEEIDTCETDIEKIKIYRVVGLSKQKHESSGVMHERHIPEHITSQ